MITPQDEPFLRRALRLAMNGRGHVEPNPMVGCVLVKNDQIIGEGWHQKFGEAHAEPNALNDCKAKGNDPAGATAYVTLEPCCHTNKKTPPCAPRLIEAKVSRVVIGCLDPNPDVNGKGVAMLRDARIEVEVLPGPRSVPLSPVVGGEGRGEGVDSRPDQEALRPPATTPSPPPSPPGTGERELDASHFQQLIGPFNLRTTYELPWITMKWAETADGTVSGANGTRLAISNDAMNRVVHQLRTRCDAILVGIGTVLADNPSLTVRHAPIVRTPHRFVLDTRLRMPLDRVLVKTAREVPTTVISSVQHRDDPDVLHRAQMLRDAGVIVHDDIDDDDTGRLSLSEVLHFSLQDRADGRLRSDILIEAGPTLADAMLPMTHRLWVIRSSTVRSPHGRLTAAIPATFVPVATLSLSGDTLTEYLNTRSPAFFAAVPSADFVLAAEEAGHGLAWPSRP